MGAIDRERAGFVVEQESRSWQDYSDGGYSERQLLTVHEHPLEIIGFDALEEQLHAAGEQLSSWFREGPTWSSYNIPGEAGSGSEYTPRDATIETTASWGKDYIGKLLVMSLKPEDEPDLWVPQAMDTFTRQAEKSSDFLRRMVTVRAVMRANE